MRHKIGIIDSGMGGLTVVRSFFEIRVPLDIVYVGDNANMPYGNRSFDEIVALTKHMLDVLAERKVEVVAIACNTISATVERLRPLSSAPLVDIISPAARALAMRGESDVGLFATEFTVTSGLHAKLVSGLNPAVKVHAVPSRKLAALIDGSIDDEKAIRDEIALMLASLGGLHSVKTVLLGCTHYPIVKSTFEALAPDISFIDPATLQADEVLRLLSVEKPQNGGSLSDADGAPSLSIVTSGDPVAYRGMLQRLGIPGTPSISRL